MAPVTDAPTVCATVWNATMAAMGMSISRLKLRKIVEARDFPSDWIWACVTVRMTASAVEQRNDTASENRTTRASVSTPASLSVPCRYAKSPCVGSSATGRARELLLLLELRDGPRAFDRGLLDLAVRRAGERVQELRHAVELTRLEQRLEVVVR